LSCLVRIAAICTRLNRFGTTRMQSSIVMRAMRPLVDQGGGLKVRAAEIQGRTD